MKSAKTLVILGSARKNGNTSSFVARKVQNCEILDLLDHKIDHYTYEVSQRRQDDFLTIAEKMIDSTEIVFATPVYWYAMSGRLKIFFDRLTELVTTDKAFGRRLAGKSVRVLVCGTDEVLPPGFEIPFELTARYFEMEFISMEYCQTLD